MIGLLPYFRQKQILISARSALAPSQSSGGDLAEMQDTRKVRDTALSINSNDAIPKCDVNREYFAEEHDHRARAGLDYESSYGKVQPNDTITKLKWTTPYYKRNQARICSFFIRGECKRGAKCAYRHEIPVTGELSQQNIKDRYYGYVEKTGQRAILVASQQLLLILTNMINQGRMSVEVSTEARAHMCSNYHPS